MSTTMPCPAHSATACRGTAAPRSGLAGLARRVATALALQRQRRRLADLDDRLLDDIGLCRDRALAEAGRPLWDVPAHWLR